MKAMLLALSLLLSAQVMALEVGETAVETTVTQFDSTGNHTVVPVAELDEGDEFILVEFFAFWCYYCNKSKPVIKALTNAYEGKLTVRAITNEPISDFSILSKMASLQTEEPLLNIASDDQENFPSLEAYGIQGFPTFFLLDKNGKVLHKHVGLLTDQTAVPFHNVILGL
jgi:thiol-disulfide isomerase/thioredoxin